MTITSTGAERLVEIRGHVSPTPRVHYVDHTFEVPRGTRRLRVTLRFHKERQCQLFLSVFGPGGYRGTRMNPGAVGDVELVLEFGEHTASPGALPGPLEPGVWRAQIDVERTSETADYLLTVEALPDDPVPAPTPALPPNGRPGRGWYRGELHAHTHHSDGKPSPARLAASARRHGLDFIALTDHFTTAGWTEMLREAGEDLAVIPSLEITGHAGHANLHGLREWVDPFVDRPGGAWTINDAARATRAQGGLFCVNHAFSNDLGWRYHAFDWSLCDLYEIYHHLEGPNNAAQLTLWDGLLRAGHRVTGVAGTDSHDPDSGRHRLGQVMTVVHAEELSPRGVLDGLRAGRAYVTLGPELSFEARSGSARAFMGDTLPLAGEIALDVGLRGLRHPVRVFVMKNGLYFTHVDLPASPDGARLSFTDSDPTPGYYRVEVYARPAQPEWFGGREWQLTQVLGNPIHVGGPA